MKRIVSVTAITAFGIIFAPAASACVALPRPFDPAKDRYDVALIGKVTNEVGKSGTVLADLQIQKVITGRYPYSTYPLRWHVYDGKGMCPPPGPNVKKGQVVIVYLAKSTNSPPKSNSYASFRAKGWGVLRGRRGY